MPQVGSSFTFTIIHSIGHACLLGLIRCLFLLWVAYLYLPVIILVLLYLSTKHRTYIMSQIISALVHKYLPQKLELTYYNQKKKNSCIQSQYEFKVFTTKCEFSYVIFSLANSSFSARPSTLNQLFPNSVMTK